MRVPLFSAAAPSRHWADAARRLRLVLAIAAAAGAWTLQASAQPADGATSGVAEVRAQQSELSPELMYRLLVAEIALQRGQPALAARAYYEAAREGRTPFLARRATEIGLATRQRAIALQSARLWIEIDPDAERPKQVVTALAAAGNDSVPEASVASTGLESQLQRLLADAALKGPALGEAFLQLNRLLAQELDRPATLKLVQTLAAPYDSVPEAHFAIALAAYNTGAADMGTTAGAIKEVDRALALNPGWDRAVLLKADILNRQSPEAAVAWLERYLKIEPNSRPIAGSLAQFYVQQKRFADARALFDGLVAAEPSNRELQLGRAALSMQMKDWSAAETQLQALQALAQDDDGTVAFYLAEVAEDSGRLPLAVERFKAVPEGERAWLGQLRVATVLGKMKRLGEAQRYLADLPAVTIEQRVQVRQTEAQLLRDAGDNAEAYALLEKALVEHPDQSDLLYDAAMVAEKLNRVDIAEARLKRVVDLKPDNAQALNALGYTLVDRTDRHAEGMQYIERALQISPDDAFILDSMGWAHYRMGRLEEAERYLRRAIAGRPDAEIAAHLGEVLWVKGERDHAQEIWQSQLKSAPDNAVLLETVRRLAH